MSIAISLRQTLLRAFAVLICTCSLCAAQIGLPADMSRHTDDATLFQVSTLDALMLGVYQGAYSIGGLKQHGDFGLGTFEGIDGELTVLEDHYYHFRSDGSLIEEESTTRVPFAVVTKFQPDFRFAAAGLSMTEIGTQIDRLLPSQNLFYAIRIHGTFSELTTRAIPKLFPPYPPLSEAVMQEVLFPFSNIAGTVVALRCPAFVKGINQVGYHYHFISDDRKVGGHCLSFTTGRVTIEVQIIRQSSVWLPTNKAFLDANLPISQ